MAKAKFDALREMRKLAKLGDDCVVRDFMREHADELSAAFAVLESQPSVAKVLDAAEKATCALAIDALNDARDRSRVSKSDAARGRAIEQAESLAASAEWWGSTALLDVGALETVAESAEDEFVGFWFGESCVAVDRKHLLKAVRTLGAMHKDLTIGVDRKCLSLGWRGGKGLMRFSAQFTRKGDAVFGVTMRGLAQAKAA